MMPGLGWLDGEKDSSEEMSGDAKEESPMRGGFYLTFLAPPARLSMQLQFSVDRQEALALHTLLTDDD